MRINKAELYYVDLYDEPKKINDHSKSFTKTLTFTGEDLIKAIVSAGMPDVYLTRAELRNRREEIEFKTKLFETFVDLSPKRKLSFDNFRREYLDSSEVGAINYWIGMILTTLLGQIEYKYEYMVHLSMIYSFSSQIHVKSRPIFSKTGKISFKSPDLLAINTLKNTYGIFESKGCRNYSSKAMERGYTQAKSIKKINGNSPNNRLVVMVQTGRKNMLIREKDPDEGEVDLYVNPSLLCLYHFLPIAELIMELGPKEQGGRTSGILEYRNSHYSVSIPSSLFQKLSEIKDLDIESFSNEYVFDTVISELDSYCSELKEGILRVE